MMHIDQVQQQCHVHHAAGHFIPFFHGFPMF